jgi:2-oxoglutarate dehydrogenase E1 component
VLSSVRIPLIVMSPKSLLRHRLAVSPVTEFLQEDFQPLLDEIDTSLKPDQITRLIFCSGKVYYELLEERHKRKDRQTAIVRLEQLYPIKEKLLKALLRKYPEVKDYVWCQEEPHNQGAWFFIRDFLEPLLGKKNTLRYVGRAASAAPAVGYMQVHQAEQKALLEAAFKK